MKTSLFLLGAMTAAILSVGALAACGGGVVGGGGNTNTGGTSTGGHGGQGTGGQGTGGAKVCGGITGATCAATEYCDFADDSCGAADAQGLCTPRPQSCIFEAPPWEICACDGKVYGDMCSAAMAGFDVAAQGSCAVQPGQFGCGAFVCQTASQYCQIMKSDVAGEPDSYTCVFLPAACTAPADCACLAAEPCGNICSKGADGHLVATCPGG